jgi:hypothetical protein
MGAAGAAAAAAAINALKAMGVVVRVEPQDFLRIVQRVPDALVVHSPQKFFGTRHYYLVSYKGLAFCTKSPEELRLPGSVEIVRARSIYLPH